MANSNTDIDKDIEKTLSLVLQNAGKLSAPARDALMPGRAAPIQPQPVSSGASCVSPKVSRGPWASSPKISRGPLASSPVASPSVNPAVSVPAASKTIPGLANQKKYVIDEQSKKTVRTTQQNVELKTSSLLVASAMKPKVPACKPSFSKLQENKFSSSQSQTLEVRTVTQQAAIESDMVVAAVHSENVLESSVCCDNSELTLKPVDVSQSSGPVLDSKAKIYPEIQICESVMELNEHEAKPVMCPAVAVNSITAGADGTAVNPSESAKEISHVKDDDSEKIATQPHETLPASSCVKPAYPVAVLRSKNINRKASAVMSFTTDDFDLFQIGKSQTIASIKDEIAEESSAAGENHLGLTRRRSVSFGVSGKFTGDTKCANNTREDTMPTVSASKSSDNLSHFHKPCLVPELGSTSTDANTDQSTGNSAHAPAAAPTTFVTQVKGAAGAAAAPTPAAVVEPAVEAVAGGGSGSGGPRKLPRRRTTKRQLAARTSTRRRQRAGVVATGGDHVTPRAPPVVLCGDGFEGEVVSEAWEDFSDSDIENNGEVENGSSTDESDIEFENELADQLYPSRSDKDADNTASGEIKSQQMSRQQRIALELLETERNYVKRLHLVDQVFHFKVVLANREHHMFPNEVVLQIFSNIKSIYQFHHDFLLPQLEKRMLQWSQEPRIGDVMRKFAPFLKLYTEYVKNFDNAMSTMTLWMDKSTRFAAIIDEIQKQSECGCLTLQHHMLEPIQRVPRYELLLKDYLKHLPTESSDREDTEKALQLVTTAACHSNEAMKKMEKFRKLLDINESLGGEVNVISPTRELVKEGKMFNDMFLVCKSLPLNIGQRQQYHVKSVMNVDELQIAEGENLVTPNTFYVKGLQKSVELHCNSLEEKMDWQEAIMNVVEDFNAKKRSRRAGSIKPNDGPLGCRAPTWVKDQDTSMCMRCSVPFTFVRRRHHCRACGMVVCGKCSAKKVALPFMEHQKQRVCDPCSQQLSECGSDAALSPSAASEQNLRRKAPAILQVKANDANSVLSGYLMMSCDKRTWQRRWFSVHNNFVLYSFKAHQDVVAMTSLPLPGYQVCAEDLDSELPDRTFKVSHAKQKKVYYFQADDRTTRNRWLDVLGKVVQLELPQNVSTSSTSLSSVSSGYVSRSNSASDN